MYMVKNMNLEIKDFIIFIMIIIYCIYVIIYEKRSIRSSLIEKAALLSKYKTIVSSVDVYDKHLEKLKNERPSYKLPKINFKNTIHKYNYLNMDYYIINKNDNLKKIFYLHGGSYIEDPLIFHFMFLDNLATMSDCEVIIPIYPKAPKYNYKDAFDKVTGLYKSIFNNLNEVILMGDSAGGGFALSLSIILKGSNISPKSIILMSPWVDITMSNPHIKSIEKKDPFLSKNALIKAGKLWSNNSDMSNYLLSPINGNFNGISGVTIFVGTDEIFLPDIRKLRKKLLNAKVKCNYYEYRKMNHVFPMYPIPEAKKAKNQIVEIIKNIK